MIDERRAGERRKAGGRRKGEKLPYLPLYIDEWDASRFVQRLTFEGRGVYVALLTHQWRDGSIPVDEADVRDILGMGPAEYPKLSYMLDKQFPIRGARRMNLKLASLRKAAGAKCKQARKSALLRWENERNANALRPHETLTASEVKVSTTNTGNPDSEPLYDEQGRPSAAFLQLGVETFPGRSRGKRS